MKLNYYIQLLIYKILKTIKKIITNENKIPASAFKTELNEFGLIEKEIINNINTKKLYEKYENNINNNIERKNIIIGEINIRQNDINKDIQVINSFKNYKRDGAFFLR